MSYELETAMQERIDVRDRALASLRARVAKLEAALMEIRDIDPGAWVASLARAALKDTPQ
jgi:hypothetical protein